jgi:hypothetical protein
MVAFHPALTIEKRDVADLVEQLDHVLEELA